MFVGASNFLHFLKSAGVCSIVGWPGTGKTLLAHAIAYELLRSGYCKHLISNCSSVWSEDLTKLDIPDPKRSGLVVMIDEGGMWLKSRSDSHDLVAFRRKMQCTFIIPSVEPPSYSLRVVEVQRVYNYTTVGIPCWTFEAQLTYRKVEETTRFQFWFPERYFGIYDTEATPVDESGIDEFLMDLKTRAIGKDYSRSKAARYSNAPVSIFGGSDASPAASAAFTDTLQESMEEMSRAAASMAKSAEKLRKKPKKKLFGIF